MKLKINKAGVFAGFIFVLPILLIYASGLPEYVGRAFSCLAFSWAAVVSLFWVAVDRSFPLITSTAKLNQPRFVKIRPKVEIFLRVFLFIFVALFIYFKALPVSFDGWDLAHGGTTKRIEAKVTDNSTLFGTWFFKQAIHIQNGGGKEYVLLFSFEKRINAGEMYEFRVLPRSSYIVEKKLLSDESIKP